MLDSPITNRPSLPAPASTGEAADELVKWLQSGRALASHERVLLVRLLGLHGNSSGSLHP